MSGRSQLAPQGAHVDLPTLLPSALAADTDAERARSRRTLRDWVVDLSCVLLPLLYGTLILRIGDASAPDPGIPLRMDALLGTLCCLALWWRRRWPLGVALVIAPFGAVSVMAVGAMTVAVFTVAVHRRAPAALLVGAANLVTTPVYVALQSHPRYPLWADLVIRTVITATAVGWGMFARARRQLVVSLRERAARLESEQHLRVEQARLTERARIAREMHDVLAHRMSLVSLHAGALEVRTDARPEEVASAAAVIRVNAHQALEELRTVIGVLRAGGTASSDRPQPGLPDVTDLVADARASGMRVDYVCRVDGDAPPAVLGRTTYRIVQEGLTNARKHAPATPVEVRVDGTAGEALRVRIRNPLPGRAAGPRVPGAGMGLVGLAERATLTGGQLSYGPGPDGFRIEATLPWRTGDGQARR